MSRNGEVGAHRAAAVRVPATYSRNKGVEEYTLREGECVGAFGGISAHNEEPASTKHPEASRRLAGNLEAYRRRVASSFGCTLL